MRLAHRAALRARLLLIEELSELPIAWGVLAKNATLPGVRLACISDLVGASHQGTDGRAEALIQIDVFSDDPNEAQALRDLITDDLHGFSGAIDDAFFSFILHESSREDIDGAASFSASADFRISYLLLP